MWGFGWRSRGLLPIDSLRRKGAGADEGGSGTGLVRVNGWLPGWETELGLEVLLVLVVVEQEEGG